ncbi:type II secretion system F family protein [Microbispora sp. CA-102843]|uniref:type II secretion system F family protein n=1 Tax=Microbispora sp. CA-102843 TaxID=3239952 RepID=UPI003D936336
MTGSLLAPLAGGLLAAGIVCLVVAVRGRAPAPPRPDGRLATLVRAAGDPAVRRQAGAAVLLGPAVFLLTGWPVAGLAAIGACFAVPRLAGGRGARSRIARLEGLEQWTRRLSDLLSAASGLEDALARSVEHPPEAIAAEVRDLGRKLAARADTEQALRAFAEALDDPVADLIAAALIRAASRRGAGVRHVLTNLAAMVAANVAARREVEAERARHRATVRWIMAFLLGYSGFAALNRDYVAPFGTTAGQVALAVVVACYAVGLWWLHRLGTARPPGRFLTGGVR